MRIRPMKDFLVYGFATYGLLWTIAESFGSFFPEMRPEGVSKYIVLVGLSVLTGLFTAWPRRSVELEVPNSDSSIKIEFGDIFDKYEIVVVPVNEFFDGLLGDNVAKASVHGQFIKNKLGGKSNLFNDLTSNALKDVPSEKIDRSNGRQSKYPIGTTAVVDVNERRYLLTAFTRTDVKTLKASATIHEEWDALAGIWRAIRNSSNGKIAALPLLGSGLSGVGLPPKNLIEIVVNSFFYYTKERKIADCVVLILPTSLENSIDLLAIKRNWS